MSAFEDFVNLELPRRPTMLTQAITSYDGDPNSGGAPAIVALAPKGSLFLQDTGTALWKKNTSSAGSWERVDSDGTPVGGTGTAAGVAFWTGTGTISADASNLYWNDTSKRLGVDNASPSYALDVTGQVRSTTGLLSDILTTNTATSLTLTSTVADGAGNVAHILNTSNTITSPTFKFLSIRGNGTEKASINGEGSLSVVGTVSSIGYLSTHALGATLSNTSNAPVTLVATTTDGASAVGSVLRTNATWANSSAKLVSIQNNTTEKSYFGIDGALTVTGATGNGLDLRESKIQVYSTGSTGGGMVVTNNHASYNAYVQLVSNVGSMNLGNYGTSYSNADYAGKQVISSSDELSLMCTGTMSLRTSVVGTWTTRMAVANNGNVTFDGSNNSLFVDAVNHRVGVKNAAPSYALDVTGQVRSTTGMLADTVTTNTATSLTYSSSVADGASAIAHVFNSSVALANATAKLASFRNNAVEKAYFGFDGTLSAPALTSSTAASLTYTSSMVDGSSAVGHIFNTSSAWSNAAAKLASFRNNSTEKAYFGITGALTTPGLTGAAAVAGTGTISGTTTTITGVGTAFTTQLAIGYAITVSGQSRIVVQITSDTQLLVETAPSPTWSGASFTYSAPIANFTTNTGTVGGYFDGGGTLRLKSSNLTPSVLHLYGNGNDVRLSLSSTAHTNRQYYIRSYDAAGGIMMGMDGYTGLSAIFSSTNTSLGSTSGSMSFRGYDTGLTFSVGEGGLGGNIQFGYRTSPADDYLPPGRYFFGGIGPAGFGTKHPKAPWTIQARSGGYPSGSLFTSNIASSGTTVTSGAGNFTSFLRVGTQITAASQTKTITAIASNTSLTVDSAFSPNLSNASWSYIPANIIEAEDSSANLVFKVNTAGAITGSSDLTVNGLVTYGGLDGLAPFAGGGQASATQITKTLNFVNTVASAGDSVKLPTSVIGMQVVVFNLGANAVSIYPATGAAIDALGTNNAYSLAAGASREFWGHAATVWRSR